MTGVLFLLFLVHEKNLVFFEKPLAFLGKIRYFIGDIST